MSTELVLKNVTLCMFFVTMLSTHCQILKRTFFQNDTIPKIVITPDKALNDRRVSIRLTGFKPNQKIKLKAKRGSWVSHAEFLTDSIGCIDVNESKPISGSYDTVEGMGLFWSMEPLDKKGPVFKKNLQIKTLPKGRMSERHGIRVNDVLLSLNETPIKNKEDLVSRIKQLYNNTANKNKKLILKIARDDHVVIVSLRGETNLELEKWFAGIEFEITSSAYTVFEAEVNGTIVATALFEHLFKSQKIEEIKVREQGLAGMLYKPLEYGKYPGVVILNGSFGGINEYAANMLASHGYACFALGYFAYENLPPRCREIPLEYFENALQWMRRQEYVDSSSIAVIGRSRGGELALLLGAIFPEIKAVIAYVPPHIVMGSDLPDKGCWTHHGKTLSFVPNNVTKEEKSRYFSKPPFVLTPMYLNRLKNQEVVKKAVIPVERINGPILLISGEDDQMIPSTYMANKVIERLSRKNFQFPYQHLHYKGAGHLISQPYFPTTKAHFTTQLAFGGKKKETALASADSWEKIIQFLKKSFK